MKNQSLIGITAISFGCGVLLAMLCPVKPALVIVSLFLITLGFLRVKA